MQHTKYVISNRQGIHKIPLLLLIIFHAISANAQFDFEKMKQSFERRITDLDSMISNPSEYEMNYTSFRTETQDSVTISAWFIDNPNSQKTILVVHGFMMNKSHMLKKAKILYDEGYNIILMDLRARGASGGERTGRGFESKSDITSVVQYYFRNIKQGELILYGFSHGGRAIIHASNHNKIKKVIVEGIPFDLTESFKRTYNIEINIDINEPEFKQSLMSLKKKKVFIIIGSKDTAITEEEANKLLSFTGRKSKLEIIQGLGHDVFENNPNISDIIQKVNDFIN